MSLTLEEGRYDRQELISWWDQDRLRSSRLLVVGAGALGNEVVKDFALVGVGSIHVVDMDVIERSNLARCLFFGESDNGKFKAEVVAAGAGRLNPDCHVTFDIANIMHFGVGFVSNFDLVVGALDNREARLWVNQACRKMGMTWIDGAIEGIRGVVKVFPPAGACYECTLGERDREILAKRRSCSLLSTEEILSGKVPTTATSSALVASLEAQEAIRLLHGEPSPIANAGWVFTGETFDSYVVNYTEDEFCLAHDQYEDVIDVEYTDALNISDLVTDASSRLGTIVDAIDLEAEIIRSSSCATCGWSHHLNRRLDQLQRDEATCPTCGEIGTFDSALALAPTDELVEIGLRSLGIPSSDVISIRSGGQRVHYRLRGTP